MSFQIKRCGQMLFAPTKTIIMKLLFIHGFVEDHTIFNEVRKTITQGEQIAIDLEKVLADWHDAPEDLDVQKMASYLVKKYEIMAQDCVIGHSMGGWIASYMKEECGCKAILLASLTDQKKLITPLTNPTLIKYLIKFGIFQSSFMESFLKKDYKFQESKQLFDGLISGLIKLDKKILYQQFQILFAKVKPLDFEIADDSLRTTNATKTSSCMKRGHVFVAPSTVQGEGQVRILRYSCSHLPNIFKKKKNKV